MKYRVSGNYRADIWWDDAHGKSVVHYIDVIVYADDPDHAKDRAVGADLEFRYPRAECIDDEDWNQLEVEEVDTTAFPELAQAPDQNERMMRQRVYATLFELEPSSDNKPLPEGGFHA